MKKKYFLVLFLVLVLFLAGCGGTVTPISDETQIKNKIGQYYAAISIKDWDLAKSCCYPNSEAYLVTEQAEDVVTSQPWYNEATIIITPTIYSINIQGNEATVDLNVWTQVFYQGEHQELRQDATFILIKSGGEWYLYY